MFVPINVFQQRSRTIFRFCGATLCGVSAGKTLSCERIDEERVDRRHALTTAQIWNSFSTFSSLTSEMAASLFSPKKCFFFMRHDPPSLFVCCGSVTSGTLSHQLFCVVPLHRSNLSSHRSPSHSPVPLCDLRCQRLLLTGSHRSKIRWRDLSIIIYCRPWVEEWERENMTKLVSGCWPFAECSCGFCCAVLCFWICGQQHVPESWQLQRIIICFGYKKWSEDLAEYCVVHMTLNADSLF